MDLELIRAYVDDEFFTDDYRQGLLQGIKVLLMSESRFEEAEEISVLKESLYELKRMRK